MYISVKATYTFSNKIKLTCLPVNSYEKPTTPGKSSHQEIWISILQWKVGLA